MLVEEAVKAGLDRTEAKQWLEQGKGGPEVDKEVQDAYKQNIHGVPNYTINDRFEASRDGLTLPKDLVPHPMCHSYITHLTEDGMDRRCIQQQDGHECDSSTAIYTHVSDVFRNTALSKALAPAFAGV